MRCERGDSFISDHLQCLHIFRQSPFHKIYLKVFPVLLRLAVDVDQVSRSLYRPLVSQLIHWLTNGAQYENPETIALLSCCMDAACDTLGPLRDFGAECLGEFVKWSIKQTATSSAVGGQNAFDLSFLKFEWCVTHFTNIPFFLPNSQVL